MDIASPLSDANRWRNAIRYLARIALLAGLYALGGWLGLSLAVPPGYATIVWPASGVALACLLLWGRQVWPGVYIGSFSINVLNVLGDSFALAGHLDEVVVAAFIAAGASLQAAAGHALLQGLRSGVDLSNWRDTIMLFARGAFLPCLIGATLGVLTLAGAGTLAAGMYVTNWLTWWMGDVFGVLLVVPLVLLSDYSPIRLSWRELPMARTSGAMGMCLILSLGLTFYAWKYVSERNFEQAQSVFSAVALDTRQSLESRFESYSRALGGAAAHFSASEEVSSAEWQDYVASLQIDDTLPGMNGIGFFFAVPDEEMDAFVAQAERDGIDDLPIHPQVETDEHFIIKYIEPIERNREALGLDLSFEEGRKAAILRSRASGSPSLTQPIVLVQDQQQGPGFLLMQPITPRGNEEIVAWSYAPLIAKDFIAGLSPREGEDYTLEIRPAQAEPQAAPLYLTDAEGAFSHGARFTEIVDFHYAGQNWVLELDSLPSFERSVASNEPKIVLGGGLITTILLALLLSGFLKREATVRREVELATREIQKLMEEREGALKELHDSNRLLLMTEATAHVGHWHLDLSTRALFWSDEVYRIHGLEPGTPPSLENAIAAYHPDDRERVQDLIEDTMSDGEPRGFTARIFRADGEVRFVESIAQSERNADGTQKALFGVFADRTEEVELRNELTSARDKAEAATQAKSSFLANMSHEIRTPMNAVLGFADLLVRADLSPKHHHQAELILESGKNMMHLLNDILDLSKIEAGRISIVSTPVEIAELLQQSVNLYQPAAEHKGLTLALIADDDVPQWMACDKLRLKQIIGNLLSNAIKFTEKGGVVLKVSTSGDGSSKSLRIDVEDTGIGIPVSQHDSIFEGFTQASTDIHQTFGGTGLGLTISRRLARLMNGTLNVESAIGRGSTFSLIIPLQETRVAPAPTTETGREFGAMLPSRILVAEDNEINQMLISAMLEKVGSSCDIAPDGEKAVAMVRQADEEGDPYNLLLMDIQMPEMDGYQASMLLRNAGFDERKLVIIALTANATPEDREKAFEAGMQGYITKPFTLSDLVKNLHDLTAGEEG